MILTGKAKQDFEEWLCRPNDPENLKHMHIDLFYCKSTLERYAYYVEWLDSVGILIETGVYPQDDNSIVFSFTIYGNKSYEEWRSFPTRKQATEAAIKLANEVYNNN